MPRKTEISDYSPHDIGNIAWAVNSTPRKYLGYKTPAEEFLENWICLGFVDGYGFGRAGGSIEITESSIDVQPRLAAAYTPDKGGDGADSLRVWLPTLPAPKFTAHTSVGEEEMVVADQ